MQSQDISQVPETLHGAYSSKDAATGMPPSSDINPVALTPAHHDPTGVVMTAERRGALIAWARERRALIVEDDYDVEYRFGRDPVWPPGGAGAGIDDETMWTSARWQREGETRI